MVEYTVRVSPRARHARLRVSPRAEVEVVVPRGFDRSRIPALVREQERWIDRTVRRMLAQAPLPVAPVEVALPKRIFLRAISEEWTVEYRPGTGKCVRGRECDGRVLLLTGAVGDSDLCKGLLRRWLARVAARHLLPRLDETVRETGLTYAKAAFRGQRSRWGSCSRRGSISLNYKLLFMPETLVRYVILHELCHTVVPNHSRRFWALVAAKSPSWRGAHVAMRTAWRDVPGWV